MTRMTSLSGHLRVRKPVDQQNSTTIAKLARQQLTHQGHQQHHNSTATVEEVERSIAPAHRRHIRALSMGDVTTAAEMNDVRKEVTLSKDESQPDKLLTLHERVDIDVAKMMANHNRNWGDGKSKSTDPATYDIMGVTYKWEEYCDSDDDSSDTTQTQAKYTAHAMPEIMDDQTDVITRVGALSLIEPVLPLNIVKQKKEDLRTRGFESPKRQAIRILNERDIDRKAARRQGLNVPSQNENTATQKNHLTNDQKFNRKINFSNEAREMDDPFVERPQTDLDQIATQFDGVQPVREAVGSSTHTEFETGLIVGKMTLPEVHIPGVGSGVLADLPFEMKSTFGRLIQNESRVQRHKIASAESEEKDKAIQVSTGRKDAKKASILKAGHGNQARHALDAGTAKVVFASPVAGHFDAGAPTKHASAQQEELLNLIRNFQEYYANSKRPQTTEPNLEHKQHHNIDLDAIYRGIARRDVTLGLQTTSEPPLKSRRGVRVEAVKDIPSPDHSRKALRHKIDLWAAKVVEQHGPIPRGHPAAQVTVPSTIDQAVSGLPPSVNKAVSDVTADASAIDVKDLAVNIGGNHVLDDESTVNDFAIGQNHDEVQVASPFVQRPGSKVYQHPYTLLRIAYCFDRIHMVDSRILVEEIPVFRDYDEVIEGMLYWAVEMFRCYEPDLEEMYIEDIVVVWDGGVLMGNGNRAATTRIDESNAGHVFEMLKMRDGKDILSIHIPCEAISRGRGTSGRRANAGVR